MRSKTKPERILGLDLGAETVKVAEIIRAGDELRRGRTWSAEHCKDPVGTLSRLLPEVGFDDLAAAAVTGRMAKTVRLEVIPFKVAVAEGVRFAHPELDSVTVVSIGAHGFSVTDVAENGNTRTRENSRCSQGTGNFLRQLVERLDLDLPEADELCEHADAAPLSGRCPVILKTDLTHLANKGVERGRILAGLYDAVCDNVRALIRKKDAGSHLKLIGGVSRSARIRRNFSRTAGELGLQFVAGDREEDHFLE
ncbi:MAG: CoA activase, partial [Phycisphaeraceae bacterium]|nr:CoA activase [Phycisphaeraceae bacterium]